MVTRSLQLTQTKAKQTLKTLESLLATVDPASGEQVSISSRCAQLDNEMPFHLGVSKAVLQNVIFCHQVILCCRCGTLITAHVGGVAVALERVERVEEEI